jgi:hypothetical protein
MKTAKQNTEDKKDYRKAKSKVKVGQRHRRIMDIPPAIRAKMDEKVQHGFSLTEVARWLHEEQEQCTDLSRDSLVTTLYRYREDMKPMEIVRGMIPVVAQDAVKTIEKAIDELDELQKLYHLQRERIDIGLQFEKSSRVLNKNMTQEIAQAASILMRRHEIKMDLGHEGGRNLGTIGVRPELASAVSNNFDQDVMSTASDPISRGKALAVAKALAALDGDVGIFDFELGDDTNMSDT